MWFLRSLERLDKEVADIEALMAEAPWLINAEPQVVKGLRLTFNFDLIVNAKALPFTLAYPALFPETPPSVLPRDGQNYSSHQWGDGGELCLEYRTDNWDPAVTGAMMIKSAYRLLSGEQPALDQRAVVPSAHQVSLGQKLRNTNFRAFLTHQLRNCISTLVPGSSFTCNVAETFVAKRTWTAYVTSIGIRPGISAHVEGRRHACWIQPEYPWASCSAFLTPRCCHF